MHVIVFDDGKAELGPMTDLRAAFDIRSGAFTNLERLIARGVQIAGLRVPDHLADLTRERHPGLKVNVPVPGAVEISGRSPLPDLSSILGEAAANTGEEDGEWGGNELERPWHIKAARDQCLAFDLALLVKRFDPSRAAKATGFALARAPTAVVHPSAIFDTDRGHIVLGDYATVRPGAIIVGPAYIGPHSTVLERALIKAGTAMGPWCKVAGEVGGTIFQGYANKGHDGHLGDSWVGEWANLGAGTTNSNLLNTYGEVITRARPGMPLERTGEQFFGCIVGDHVKTAICTRIMTGAIIGTGTMWAATAHITGCVPAFSWVTDTGTRTFRFDKFMEVTRAAMSRRSITPTPSYEGRLSARHAATA
ncbi:MAG: hypothetical protein H7Y88_04505 [Phycisphaerales bacterium]|nr:hypothetical protein [Phycisphaerales bacterium]